MQRKKDPHKLEARVWGTHATAETDSRENIDKKLSKSQQLTLNAHSLKFLNYAGIAKRNI